MIDIPMAEIWMICKPDLEYKAGIYSYKTEEDKYHVGNMAEKIALKNNCVTIIKEVREE